VEEADEKKTLRNSLLEKEKEEVEHELKTVEIVEKSNLHFVVMTD
jgi:uncharacterized protein YnzC (UPF0291/DUF896 family)